jgi:hypothetical protein
MPRTVLAGTAVLVALGLATFVSSAIAVPPVHTVVVEETLPDEVVCGIPGTATIRLSEVVKETDDTFFLTGTFRYQFTATETGKSITVRASGPSPNSRVIIDETAGTITFVDTFLGLPEKISITGGPTLSRDAGTVTITTTFALDPETGEPIGEPLSQEVTFLHGPHPDLESDFNLFCEEIVPYLLDP